MMKISEVIKILESIKNEEGDILTDIEQIFANTVPEGCYVGTDEKVCEVAIINTFD